MIPKSIVFCTDFCKNSSDALDRDVEISKGIQGQHLGVELHRLCWMWCLAPGSEQF